MSSSAALDDRYVLTERLATQRFCSAYRAHDRRLRREVTVALLERHDADAGRAFQQGARRLAQATAPGAVRVYDGAGTYLVTEAIAEADLAPLLDAVAPAELALEATPGSPGPLPTLRSVRPPAGATGPSLRRPLALARRRPRPLAVQAAVIVALIAGGLSALPPSSGGLPTVEGVVATPVEDGDARRVAEGDRGGAVDGSDAAPSAPAREPRAPQPQASDPHTADPEVAGDPPSAQAQPDEAEAVPASAQAVEAPAASAEPAPAPVPQSQADTSPVAGPAATAAQPGPPAHANAGGNGRGNGGEGSGAGKRDSGPGTNAGKKGDGQGSSAGKGGSGRGR